MIIDKNLRAASPEEAEDNLSRVFGHATVSETSEPFEFGQRITGDERLNVTRFHVNMSASIALQLTDVVSIGQVRSGHYSAESNGDPIDARAPFVLRPGRFRSRAESLELTTLNMSLASLNAHAMAYGLASTPGLSFERHAAASSETKRNWLLTLGHVLAIFGDRNLLHNDLIRRSATDLVYAAALSAFFLPLTSPPREDSIHPVALRRALSYIDEHAADPIGVEQIAAAARLSVRGLQDAFRRHLGTTPMRYLRDVRLVHAHEQLVSADPTTSTVAAIAHRWGFSHPGRFATLYRDRYHQLPAVTLAR